MQLNAPLRIYIAGPYSVGDTEANIARAREAMVELFKLGHFPLCPHSMTAGLEEVPGLDYSHFIVNDLMWLAKAEAILMIGAWKTSVGARGEHEYAKLLGLQVFYSLDDVPDLRGGK